MTHDPLCPCTSQTKCSCGHEPRKHYYLAERDRWFCAFCTCDSPPPRDAETHDPLCLAAGRPKSWEPEMCVCDLIRDVREDERRVSLGIRVREVMPYANGYIDGQNHMIRDCIAAVEAMPLFIHDADAQAAVTNNVARRLRYMLAADRAARALLQQP